MLTNQTKFLAAEAIKNNWVLFDAKDIVVGRLAAEIAKILRGKHKANFTPNVDNGDFVVVINAKHVHLTGNKLRDDIYRWHTGWPGGLKERSQGELLRGNHPERVVENAVRRMMPKTRLGVKQLTKLRVYADATHPHEAQNPQKIEFAAKNAKNAKRG
jgi:large subunit ribosomal protein L13